MGWADAWVGSTHGLGWVEIFFAVFRGLGLVQQLSLCDGAFVLACWAAAGGLFKHLSEELVFE